jgi:hypothetical protein
MNNYEQRDGGIFLDGEKVATIAAGNHVRMAAGKFDLKRSVEEWLKNPTTFDPGDPLQPQPEPEPEPVVEPSDAVTDAGDGIVAPEGSGLNEVPEELKPQATVEKPEVNTPPTNPLNPDPAPSQPAPKASAGSPPPQDPEKGDKTPDVIRWYRDNDPVEFKRRYTGRKFSI